MANYVKVVFDRRKSAAKTGKGKVELSVLLANRQRKYVGVMDIAPTEWPAALEYPKVLAEVAKYEKIRAAMDVLGEPITLETLNKHLGVETKNEESIAEKKEKKAKQQASNASFLDFMIDSINKEKQAYGTLQKKRTVVDALRKYGKIKKMSDLTPQNIQDFDEWLHSTADRTDVTVYAYHKWVRKYALQAYQRGYIAHSPYEFLKISRGKSKERQPLTEEELKKMRKLDLRGKEAKVRDLFIFSAYTGLAYCDTQEFDFETMTEKHGRMYYIDGSRIKTGTKFFTPILAPAMAILKKYNYHLPRISNQKLNDYLHLVESRMCLNKPLTFHVARHSFATLSLAHDVPIENVARMLGHTDIRTTQIYAKILKTSIERHAENLARGID